MSYAPSYFEEFKDPDDVNVWWNVPFAASLASVISVVPEPGTPNLNGPGLYPPPNETGSALVVDSPRLTSDGIEFRTSGGFPGMDYPIRIGVKTVNDESIFVTRVLTVAWN